MTHAAARPIGLDRLGPLWLLVFVDAMGFAMIVPILAANPLSPVPAVQAVLYGIAVGIYPLATFFAAPLLGAMSDRHGRLPVMLVCGGGLVASYAAIACGFEIGSAALVIAGRLVGGLTAATQAVALASLADLGPAETKDSRINIGLLSSSLGFVLGPVLSGALAGWGFGPRFDRTAPLVAIVAIALATLAWLAATYREPGRTAPAGAARLDLFGSLRELGQAFSSPVLRRLSAIFLLQQLGWGAFFFFIPVFLIARFGLRAAEVSYFMGVMGAGFCLSFAVVTPLLRRLFKPHPIGIGAMVVTTASIVAAIVVPSATGEWLIAVPVATAVAVAYGAVISLFTEEANGNEGGVLGVTASINALAFGLTSLAGGIVSGGAVVGPIVVAAVMMAASTLLLLTLRKPRGQS